MVWIDKDATLHGADQSRQTADTIRQQADAARAAEHAAVQGLGPLYIDFKESMLGSPADPSDSNNSPAPGLIHAKHAAHHRLADAYDGLATKDTNTVHMFDTMDENHANQTNQTMQQATPPETQL